MVQLLSSVPVALRQLHDFSHSDPIDLMDAAFAQLRDGSDIAGTLDQLSDGLWWLRSQATGHEWSQAIARLRDHPAMEILHENPFTSRAFSRPRGYAGDAPLIDLLYSGRDAPDLGATSAVGLAMLDRDTNAPAAVAVRERREFMAGMIDHVCDHQTMPHILVAACGHLREGLISRAVQEHRVGRLVALDQDADSLAVVARHFGIKGVEPVNRSVKALMDGSFAPASFDLIYAAGLYDYLGDRFAAALTLAMFNLLRPGGRLVVGNFARDIYDAGYMEAIADWFLVYRDATAMEQLASRIPPEDVMIRRVYTRHSPDIVYLEVRKRPTSR